MPGELRIGISGWNYPKWRGVFFPKGLAQRRELEYASQQLNSIEVNGTFYSLQKPSSFGSWHDQTPEDFVFALKGSRYITHMRRLKDVETPLANFFASGVLRLGAKLGPILWQFPERMKWDEARFEQFAAMLPRDTEAAAKLARKHDGRLKERAFMRVADNRPIRHAMEIRSESFLNDAFIDLLRRHNVAWVIADAADRWPSFEQVTADFVYIRLHGAKELYTSGYDEDELHRWADRIAAWRDGREPTDATKFSEKTARKRRSRDVYVYFDNDVKVHAPFNAMRLSELLGVGEYEYA